VILLFALLTTVPVMASEDDAPAIEISIQCGENRNASEGVELSLVLNPDFTELIIDGQKQPCHSESHPEGYGAYTSGEYFILDRESKTMQRHKRICGEETCELEPIGEKKDCIWFEITEPLAAD
jgi:hypothetical protein